MNQDFNVTVAGASVAVTVTSRASAVDAYVRSVRPTLSGAKLVVGVDVEWNSADPNAKTALLQLCVGTKALVVQLLFLDHVPQSLIDFLSDSSVTSVGVGITADVARLVKDYGLKCNNPVELGSLANSPGIGLAELAKKLLGINIEKKSYVTLSNWAVSVLTHDQIVYAVTDAYAGYQLGVKLLGRN